MGDLLKFLRELDDVKSTRIAFGSGRERPKITERRPSGRIKFLLPQEGNPNLSPLTYNNNHFTIEYELRKLLESSISLHKRTSLRLPQIKDKYPGRPFFYHFEGKREVKSAFIMKPPQGNSRKINANAETKPGPGAYSPPVVKKYIDRKAHSFGNTPIWRPVVNIKCEPQNKDKCNSCSKKPVGTYYQHKKTIYCRNCYAKGKTDKKQQEYLSLFEKVRHCNDYIHIHEGTYAATFLKTEKEMKKLQSKEIYLHKYIP